MTKTLISSATKEVVIGFDQPFVIIGERINPSPTENEVKIVLRDIYEKIKVKALIIILSSTNS